MPLADMPEELLSRICAFLDAASLARLHCTARSLRASVASQAHLWDALARADFVMPRFDLETTSRIVYARPAAELEDGFEEALEAAALQLSRACIADMAANRDAVRGVQEASPEAPTARAMPGDEGVDTRPAPAGAAGHQLSVEGGMRNYANLCGVQGDCLPRD